jgi:predicted methyltransferase
MKLRPRLSLALGLLLCGLGCTSPLPAGEGKPAAAAPRKPAPIMDAESASWLEREERDREEHPEIVLAAMDLKPGQTVADVGAGTGYFSRRLARAVGPSGKVYAVDVQPEMIARLTELAARDGIGNIVPVVCSDVDPKLPAGKIDRALLVDVYHEFQQPRPMLAKIRASLAPGGEVILVEYRLEGETAAHYKVEHRMAVAQILAEWEPAGFTLLRQIETLPTQHLLVFTAKRGARPVP